MKDSFKNTDGIFMRRQNQSQPRRTLDNLAIPSRYTSTTRSLDQTRPTPRDLPPVLTRSEPRSTLDTAPEPPHRQSSTALKSIDIDLTLDDEKKPSKKRRTLGWRPTKRFWKWLIIVIIILILAVAGFVAWKVFFNASKIFQGNIFNAVTSVVSPDKPLKADKYGNVNVLLLGTSESDPGHPGAQLTDSMMIVSIDQKNHKAFLLSIPRDLWVKYEEGCSVGYSGKINAAYICALENANDDEAKAEKSVATTVSKAFGADIQYVAHLNLAVVQKVVDAVGGIDIIIESPDPQGILDRNFDWRCKYKCYLVKYSNGPTHLDGEHAMWLAQARNDGGGYGLPRGNFDREANQRKILIAVEKKALSANFLANPLNVTNLLDALGDNVHTTIDSSEIKSFITLAKNTPPDSITSVDVINDAPGILTTGAGPDGSSIVRPVAGIYDYSKLQALTDRLLQGGAPILQEKAKIDVLNGSGVSGAAAKEAATLEGKGFIIGAVDSAPDSFNGAAAFTLYDLSKGGKPSTLAALKKELGVTTVSTTLPAGVTSSASFVVILGKTSTSSGASQ